MIKLKKLLVEVGVLSENASALLHKKFVGDLLSNPFGKPDGVRNLDQMRKPMEGIDSLDPESWAKIPKVIREALLGDILQFIAEGWRLLGREGEGHHPGKDNRRFNSSGEFDEKEYKRQANVFGFKPDGKEGPSHERLNKSSLEDYLKNGKYGFVSAPKEAEEALLWLSTIAPKVGKKLYDTYKDLPKIIASLDAKDPSYLANYEKNVKPLKDAIKLGKSIGSDRRWRSLDMFKQVIGGGKYDKIIGNVPLKKEKRTGPVEMSLTVSHIKDGTAAVPKKLLDALPNKTQITQLISKINAGDVDLEPDNELLYQYDELLEKGVRDLMKKLGVNLANDDISLEDDNMNVYTTVDASKMKSLKKLGFKEE